MVLKRLKGADILFYLVITYVMVAGSWWSYLLYIKNSDALNAKKEVLWLQMKEQGITDRQVYLESAEYTRLIEQYGRQKWMIFGESSVLLILIVLGIWRIAQSRQKELALAEQQRNFLLSITHELKSPIAVIKLTLDTFNKRTLTAEQSKMLTTNALADTDRLNKLVEDLLLAARVDGGYQYTFESLDLGLLLQKCIKIAAPKYSGTIEFNNNVGDATLNRGDQTTLSSVFLNIIENAIKYAPNTSKIIISLMQNKENTYCVEISDFGPGISKLERENIFEKFYRIGNEDTRKTKGTGLGLYIVKQIVKAHKGNVSIKSNQPTGSIFTISLPKA
ncbi:sensor histidine kinase KdpD [Aureispira sp. CCB-QB1]|uniref:sensor histidine kinase n=1 Tax=Aureispira sp. CCB-QB1 TaxID=1313421 RepID=UPI00069704FC|nr:HAMP domain-containing sensor histidine kinase [Aureispira sp. CCB-QB1]